MKHNTVSIIEERISALSYSGDISLLLCVLDNYGNQLIKEYVLAQLVCFSIVPLIEVYVKFYFKSLLDKD